MVDINKILEEVIHDVTSIGFPVPKSLIREIVVDMGRYDRVGACYRYKFPEKYVIHLSEATQKAKLEEIKNIIAHEVLHTNFMTMEHNCFWQMYQQCMNDKLGYNIQIKYSWRQILK